MLEKLLEAPRPVKRLASVTYDALALSCALYLAWALRIGSVTVIPTLADISCLLITLAITIFVFIRLGLYRAILRYMTHDAAFSVFLGLLLSSLTLAATSFFLNASIPRSVPVIYWFVATLIVGLPRMMVRNIVQLLFPTGDTKVLIYGAGSSGRLLADSLRQSKEFQPVSFVDDDWRLQNSRIRGLTVHSSTQINELLENYNIEKIFLALGNIDRPKLLRIVRNLEPYSIQIQTIPALEKLTSGQINIEEIRDIQIEDLLGRDPVQPNTELMRTNIYNKVVMVTGAGGSIGSELCRQIIDNYPTALILLELNEYNLYKIEDELSKRIAQANAQIKLIPLLGSVQHQNRLEVVMKSFKVQTVYHAAAYKHVPLVEHNMIEGIRNNVFGTYYCAQAAKAAHVETFVLISTDKAVRATNIMGASKRLAELTLQTMGKNCERTRFCMVRFGNVLGSSGSVVLKFREQIAKGGPVTVTHPEITRYFMTIPEAAQLVIQAGALSRGGETYVLEMGDPIKIVDLAQEMIRLSGYTIRDINNPGGDIELVFTGLRPGEKLYEELLINNNIVGTEHPRITEALDQPISTAKLESIIEQLNNACKACDYAAIHSILVETPTVYTGNGHINDLLYQEKEFALTNQSKIKILPTTKRPN